MKCSWTMRYSTCTLKSDYFTDVLFDANLEEDVDNDVLRKDVVEAAEDGCSS